MSTENFTQSVRDVRATLPLGFIGDIDRTIQATTKTGVVSHPQAVQITTISVPASPDDSTTYSITETGVDTASYLADPSSTQDEVGAGLVSAFNATPALYRRWTATYSGGTITLPGKHAGIGGML